jgi:hypothetical protein
MIRILLAVLDIRRPRPLSSGYVLLYLHRILEDAGNR